MMMEEGKHKLDKFWIGLTVGLIFPCICFVLYWLFMFSYIDFPVRFIKYLANGQMLSAAIKLCGLGNLLLFYYCLNTKKNDAAKGIIVSVLIYVALVIYVMYAHEPEYI